MNYLKKRKTTRTADTGTTRGEETAEWHNNFTVVPKHNGTVRLCLDPARLNQTLIWPLHRGPELNDIPPKLTNMCYMTIIDGSLGYDNLKHDKKSSYITTFAGQFSRYRLTRLLFAVAPAGDMLQSKINEVFKGPPNEVIGYDADGREQGRNLKQVKQICHYENLNKNKCHFRSTKMPFFGEVISREGEQPDHHSIYALIEVHSTNKKE